MNFPITTRLALSSHVVRTLSVCLRSVCFLGIAPCRLYLCFHLCDFLKTPYLSLPLIPQVRCKFGFDRSVMKGNLLEDQRTI